MNIKEEISADEIAVPSESTESSPASSDNGDIQPAAADSEFMYLVENTLEATTLTDEPQQHQQWIPLRQYKRTAYAGQSLDNDESHRAVPYYREPLSVDAAKERMPPETGGLSWYATIIPDDIFVDGKLRKGLVERDFDLVKQQVKPRRASLPVTSRDFFASLTAIDGPNGKPRYIFHGMLNGWPMLRCLELVSMEERRGAPALIPSALLWKKVWDASEGELPQLLPPAKNSSIYRAKLRGPSWTRQGWSHNSPGFCFWFEGQHPDGPRLTHGTDMLQVLGQETCTRIHMISHRYAVVKESPRDRLTYHSMCLLEWDHGQYCSVLEAAYLNGLGGYQGKSNWIDDKDDPGPTSLYAAMPFEMIGPWSTKMAEIRAYDVKPRSFDEMKEYIERYRGPDKRFVDPHYTFSHVARLGFRSKNNIAQYLINYISRDTAYGELRRNCQTFAADLCSFVAGKKNIVPFHPVNRIDYTNRTYLFLYDSNLYKTREERTREQRQQGGKPTPTLNSYM